MDGLLFHPKTKKAVERVIVRPPQALLISGTAGSGKTAVAHTIASGLLHYVDINKHPFVKFIDAAAGEGIAQIRDIRKFLTLKTTGSDNVRRIIIVENADSLGSDAQNALLKTLEEPPEDTVIILTASHTLQLLATIRSRVQVLQILPLSLEQCIGFQTYETQAVKKAYALSGGKPGLFVALLGEDNDHYLVIAVTKAKQFLIQSSFERLSNIDAISKDKEQTASLLLGLEKCLHAALLSARNDTASSLHARLSLVSDTSRAFEHSANSKLLLTNLCINL